jgi:iron complex transport system substrate-binding protein
MNIFVRQLAFLFVLIAFFSCKENKKEIVELNSNAKSSVKYCSGLTIEEHGDFSIVRITNPWPNANKKFTYILKEKKGIVPDSLVQYPVINVPIKRIVVTSTTNIPFLEMLGVEKSLVGFPHTDYVSSTKTRKLIDAGFVKEIGENEKLNIEKLIELAPDLIVTFGVDNNNTAIENLQKSGLKVLIQGDWMEQTPLGKAEWIKLYGTLFKKEKEARAKFETIENDYKKALELALNAKKNPTVLYGSMYQDQWYVAKGSSWVAQFIKDAKANYLWTDSKGSGSLSLSFEKVLEKGKTAKFWITSGGFKTKAELLASNPHYAEFDSFKYNTIYSFDTKIGAKGGLLFYETSASRPDLVLKDYIKIFHPELVPNYTFTFAKKLE